MLHFSNIYHKNTHANNIYYTAIETNLKLKVVMTRYLLVELVGIKPT